MGVRFADVTVEFGSRTIARNGQQVALSPKAFDLLRLLIEQRPGVVTFATLRQQLWPDSHVGPTSLPALIAEIRAALDETARTGITIRTVHRVGYAFAADVTTDSEPRAVPGWLLVGDRWIPLSAGEHVLGREGSGVIALSDSTVSRRHARIVISTDGATLEDLGSKNGTWMDGGRLERAMPLPHDGRFLLGTLNVQFTRSRPAKATETVPPADLPHRRPVAVNKSPRTRPMT